MALSIDSTLQELKANKQAKEILAKHLPGIWEHPQMSMALGFSLRVIAGFPQAGITPEKLQAVADDLSNL